MNYQRIISVIATLMTRHPIESTGDNIKTADRSEMKNQNLSPQDRITCFEIISEDLRRPVGPPHATQRGSVLCDPRHNGNSVFKASALRRST